MAEINDGGPAFPRMGGYVEGTTPLQWASPQAGMSLRDWIAGQALAGMLDFSDVHSYQIADAAALEVATSAYKIADAMLAERAKPAAADTNRALIAELVEALGPFVEYCASTQWGDLPDTFAVFHNLSDGKVITRGDIKRAAAAHAKAKAESAP